MDPPIIAPPSAGPIIRVLGPAADRDACLGAELSPASCRAPVRSRRRAVLPQPLRPRGSGSVGDPPHYAVRALRASRREAARSPRANTPGSAYSSPVRGRRDGREAGIDDPVLGDARFGVVGTFGEEVPGRVVRADRFRHQVRTEPEAVLPAPYAPKASAGSGALTPSCLTVHELVAECPRAARHSPPLRKETWPLKTKRPAPKSSESHSTGVTWCQFSLMKKTMPPRNGSMREKAGTGCPPLWLES